MIFPLVSYVKGLFFIWSFTCAILATSSASMACLACMRASSSRRRLASRSFLSLISVSSSSSSRSSSSGICCCVFCIELFSSLSAVLLSPPCRDGARPCEAVEPSLPRELPPRRRPTSSCPRPFGCTSFLRMGTQARAHVSTRHLEGSDSSVQLSLGASGSRRSSSSSSKGGDGAAAGEAAVAPTRAEEATAGSAAVLAAAGAPTAADAVLP
mmetsp:Transcript_26756/g.67288  ORF Transcript_26756/g.67288 Transcript_26756/m.67288 type:complete len:212 (-) Transcript_26756:196-831(-)